VSAVAVALLMRGVHRCRSYRENLREMWAYTLPLLALALATRVQGPIESLVVRHRLPAVDSAGYYYAVTFGAIPGYLTGALSPFLWSMVSDRFERGQSTARLFVHSQVFNLLAGGALTALLALVMPWVFSLPGPWRPYSAYAGFVWQVGLIRTLRQSLEYFTAYETACRRFRYVAYVAPLMLLEAGLLYGLPAWPLARPYVPEGLWQWVADRAAPSLPFFMGIMVAANAAFVAAMGIHLALRRGRAAAGGVQAHA
jgi:hypothetical protein